MAFGLSKFEKRSWEDLAEKKPEVTGKETLDNKKFLETIDDFFVKQYKQGKKPHVILVTYNRVGKGELRGKEEKSNYIMEILSGASDERFKEENIDGFLKETKESLEEQLPKYKKNPPLMVFYGGEGKKFNKTAKVIDELDSDFVLHGFKPKQKPKIFLLSCPCQREEKIKAVLPLIKLGRLQGLICEEKQGERCGGFDDLQKIADHIKKNYSPDSTLIH